MKKYFLFFLFLTVGVHIQGQKILFVGNSLTYTNDLPNILVEIGNGFDKNITTEMVCKPNYAIVDHLDEGIIQQKITTEKYDYVIIQQGPSSQKKGREMLLDTGKKLRKLCEKYGAKLGYYMVWPSKRYYFTFDKVIANHTEAAEKNNALLFPVGKYWKQYEAQKPRTSLYGPDQFHPSKAGSFFAALVIFKGLYPTENLKKLPLKKVKHWVDRKSYTSILKLLN